MCKNWSWMIRQKMIRQKMIRGTMLRGALLAALVCSVANAQTDSTDPKAALKNVYSAVQRADAEAIRQAILVENDPQEDLARAYAATIVAGKKLADAAKQKFPGVAVAFTQGTIFPEDARQIDTARVSVNGDSATINIAGQPTPRMMRRVDGNWRLYIPTGNGNASEDRTRLLTMLKAMTDAMTLSANEINDNKYTDIQDAESTVKERLGAVWAKSLQENPPTSRPTSQP
jgi:hypothetical protein